MTIERATDRSSIEWSRSADRMLDGKHYLDAFLGDMKRQANLGLIREWSGNETADGTVLKTDLFEEAFGPDAFLADLAPLGSMVVGMDVSLSVAAAARRNESLRGCHLVVADVRRVPFAPSSITLISSPSTLDHFQEPSDLGRSLIELRRTLQSDGRMVITLDNRQNLFDPLLRLVIRLGLVPFYVGRSYSVTELNRELEQAGWKVLDRTAIVHNPRLVATGLVAVSRVLRWRWFARSVQRFLSWMQRFGKTRWRYRTGCFVAALAVPGNSQDAVPESND